MFLSLSHSLTALVALLPAALLAFRPEWRRDAAFWGAVVLAFAGPAFIGVVLLGGHWMTGFAPALWVSIAATVLLFAICAAFIKDVWRLLPLLAPYLVLLGLMATVWQSTTGAPLPASTPAGWIGLHIAVGVATYALLTLAAVSALAAALQERALKRKQPTRLSRQLPSVADSERVATMLLALSEVVLGVGLLTGMAVEWSETGRLAALDHKTLLSVLAFAVIGLLLLARRLTGVRGKAAARYVLVAYLMLTLAYPGVKFVTEVLAA
jgi:ABC-type uncharacterized transport system permease subunit